MAAVSFDANSVANSGGSAVANVTWAHTVGASADRLLIVALSWLNTTTTLTNVTFNGVAMTLGPGGQTDTTSSYHTKIFYMINPPTGTFNIIATPSANSSIYGGATSFAGVDQANPLPSHNETTGSGSGAQALALVTTIDSSWIFSSFSLANFTSTITASQTQAFNEGNTTIARRHGGQYQGPVFTPASTNSTWTISGGTSRSWGHQVVEIASSDGPLRTPRYAFVNHSNPGIF